MYLSKFIFDSLNLVILVCIVQCQETEVKITTKKGPVVGVRFNPNPRTGVSYDSFLGIPYGDKPPRFQLAQPRQSWLTPLPAKSDGPPCPQPDISFSEDCLYLNVFTPLNASESGDSLPVMVYIHGSAFTFGSSSSLSFGPDFLVNASVLLVTMNFRIGAAGFLTLGSAVAPGNLGLHDTLLALQWVQDEISGFGGNPSQVTLFGQSSGSIMTQFHYLSPLSTGLFARVIAQSGSALADWGHYTVTEGRRRAKMLAQAVHCDTTQSDTQILACLQKVEIQQIVNNQSIQMSTEDIASGNYLPFIPVLDSQLTADKPFFNASLTSLLEQALDRGKPILTGFTRDEGIVKFVDDAWRLAESHLAAFIPYNTPLLSDQQRVELSLNIHLRYFPESPDQNKVRQLVNLYTDAMWAYPSVQCVPQHTAATHQMDSEIEEFANWLPMSRFLANLTYSYVFGYDGLWAPVNPFFEPYGVRGVAHGADLLYIFFSSKYDTQDLSPCSSNQHNINMKDYMVQRWTNFAKSGVPDKDWRTVSVDGYLFINSSPNLENVTEFESRFYDFWANMTQAHSADISHKLHTSVLLLLYCIVFVMFKLFC